MMFGGTFPAATLSSSTLTRPASALQVATQLSEWVAAVAAPCLLNCNWRCAIHWQVSGSGRSLGLEGYCVKCREKREIKDAERVEMDNGRKSMQGVCPVCDTKIVRFVKDDAW